MASSSAYLRPDPFALSEDERSVRETAREFAARELAPTVAQRDEDEHYDISLFRRMGEAGLTAIPYPEELGGAGLSYFAWVLACEEIAAADMGMAISLCVHVLSQLCVFAYGNDEQRARLLPPMTSGAQLGAFALTEPGAGSDAAALSLRAERHGDHYTLSGTKIWITNAGAADRYIVFATVDRARARDGITAFVVDGSTPGLRVGAHEKKMGLRDSCTAEIVFDSALVPVENRLGAEGEGLKVALGSLESGRISIAAACTGLARAALEYAARYAVERKQFGKPIADQQMIKAMLADAAVAVEASRLLTWRAARLRDAGRAVSSAGSMAKMYASDTAMRVTTDAVQIYGGAGYSRENPVERLMRDAKVTQIFEGTNQVQRLIIAQELIEEIRRSSR